MPRLTIIAGHGAGDPGAVGNGYQEAEQVRRLASKMAEIGGTAVRVMDMSRNWYADNGIGRGQVPNDAPVLELHRDSASPSAKGGHVVVNSRFPADVYDNALATFISSFFPGRSLSIVSRSDLANSNRAVSMGLNYRLLECGFITNFEDTMKFESQLDELASGILECFGIGGDIVTNEDIEKIATRVWQVQAGKDTADRAYRCTSMLKAMCGIGAEDTGDPKNIAKDIQEWTIGRWQRCTAMLKALLGIDPEDMSSEAIITPAPVHISDEDVDRIAEKVAAILKTE